MIFCSIAELDDYPCRECRHSVSDRGRYFAHLCLHPKVMADDEWAEWWPRGVDCRYERGRKFGAPCGKIGTLWEQRKSHHQQAKPQEYSDE